MALPVPGSSFRLTDLPAELIIEIILWAQVIWREEAFPSQVSYAGVKRYALAAPVARTFNYPTCCDGVNSAHERPHCLHAGVPASSRSPAHNLSQTGKRLRDILLHENSAIWRLDNVLYKVIVERSGVQRTLVDGHVGVEYGSRTLIASHVCSCLLRTLPAFRLENLKIAIPRQRPDGQTPDIEDFLLQNARRLSGTLRRIDLEVYSTHPLHAPHSPHFVSVRGIRCDGLHTSRFASSTLFLYSNQLTSLFLYQSLAHKISFDGTLSAALQACSAQLEYLTLDAGGAKFHRLRRVALPKLRYLRLVAPEQAGGAFLSSLTLPSAIDLHLEPVIDWRWLSSWASPLAAPFEVPFWEFDEDAAGRGEGGFWRYAAAVAAPEQSLGAFDDSVGYHSDFSFSLWSVLDTAGLDIRIDPLTTPGERACGRFPEYVRLALAGSVKEMEALLAESSGDPVSSQPPQGDRPPRRSLSARDGRILARERRTNPSLPKPLYDTVQYVTRTLLTESEWNSFTGQSSAMMNLVFHRDTWLPKFALGWLHILASFPDIVSVLFLCPYCPPDGARITENREGRLDPSHLEALALYLNEPGEYRIYPCLRLRTVRFRQSTGSVGLALSDVAALERGFNSRARLEAGAFPLAILAEPPR
ncbi:hypothetical protein PENSPDRAFT_687034 [Peniophora sp. CONT]|nr:hypothetical protein PENSPDRAFT_687034 [Peniophora sp. CONT]